MKVLVIPANEAEPAHAEEIEREGGLRVLQQTVGGYIEGLTLRMADGTELNMYINEDGKADGLPLNPRATKLAEMSIQHDDYIVGTAVITGPPDDDGYETDLTDEQIQGLT